MTMAIVIARVPRLELADTFVLLGIADGCTGLMQPQTRDRHLCVVPSRTFTGVILMLVVSMSGCGTPQPSQWMSQPTATPTVPATLRITATGLVRHEVIPDFATGYVITLTDSHGHTREGFFDDPRTGPTPPGTDIVGDMPTRIDPGPYQIRFSMQRVSDISSFVPVPGGTPFVTNRGYVMGCATDFDARPAVDLTITARFKLRVPDGGAPEGTCTIEIATAG